MPFTPDEKLDIIRNHGKDPRSTAVVENNNGTFDLMDVAPQSQGAFGAGVSAALEALPQAGAIAGGSALALGGLNAIPGVTAASVANPIAGVIGQGVVGAIGGGLSGLAYDSAKEALKSPRQAAVDEVMARNRAADHPIANQIGRLVGNLPIIYPSVAGAKNLFGAASKLLTRGGALAAPELEAAGNAGIGLALAAKPTYERITSPEPWSGADTVGQIGDILNLVGRPTPGLGTGLTRGFEGLGRGITEGVQNKFYPRPMDLGAANAELDLAHQPATPVPPKPRNVPLRENTIPPVITGTPESARPKVPLPPGLNETTRTGGQSNTRIIINGKELSSDEVAMMMAKQTGVVPVESKVVSSVDIPNEPLLDVVNQEVTPAEQAQRDYNLRNARPNPPPVNPNPQLGLDIVAPDQAAQHAAAMARLSGKTIVYDPIAGKFVPEGETTLDIAPPSRPEDLMPDNLVLPPRTPVQLQTKNPVAAQAAVVPSEFPNNGVGSAADSFGAVYGPELNAEQISKFSEQVGHAFPLESTQGTTTTLKVKPNMLWVETSKRIGNTPEEEVGIAYLKIRSDGTTVIDASKHGRPIDKLAADKLIQFLQSTDVGTAQGTTREIPPGAAAYQQAIGLSPELATQLHDTITLGGKTDSFRAALSPDEQVKFDQYFAANPPQYLRKGPLESDPITKLTEALTPPELPQGTGPVLDLAAPKLDIVPPTAPVAAPKNTLTPEEQAAVQAELAGVSGPKRRRGAKKAAAVEFLRPEDLAAPEVAAVPHQAEQFPLPIAEVKPADPEMAAIQANPDLTVDQKQAAGRELLARRGAAEREQQSINDAKATLGASAEDESRSFGIGEAAKSAGGAVKGLVTSIDTKAIGKAVDKEAAAAWLQDFHGNLDHNRGRGFALDLALSKAKPAELKSAVDKMNEAQMTGVAPILTPEEVKASQEWMPFFHDVSTAARAVGFHPGYSEHYVPQVVNPQKLHLAQDTAYNQNAKAKFMALNARVAAAKGEVFDAKEANDEYDGYIKRASSGGQLADFNALTRTKREYFLPDELRETDPRTIAQRYSERVARDISREASNIMHPAAGKEFGLVAEDGAKGPNPHKIQEFQDVQDMAYGRLAIPQSRRGTEFWDTVKALQNFANSATIGPVSGIRNLAESVTGISRARNIADVSTYIERSLTWPLEYMKTYNEAVRQGVQNSRPGTQRLGDDAELSTRLAQMINNGAQHMQEYGGSKIIEEAGRVKDFWIGKGLAEMNYTKALRGDPAGKKWFDLYGGGIDLLNTPRDEVVQRAAGNFTRGVQTSYGGEDVPAWVLRGGTASFLARLQKFGIGKLNQDYKHVILPAQEGNYLPLALLVGSTFGLAVPAVKAISKMWSGLKQAAPTFGEIDAAALPENEAAYEKVLTLAEDMNAGQFFGIAGGTLGNVAASLRGRAHSLILEPTTDLFINKLAGNTLRAVTAVQDGMPVTDAILASLRETLTQMFQSSRVLDALAQPQEKIDERNAARDKKVFGYLTGVDRPTPTEIGMTQLGIADFGRRPGLHNLQENDVFQNGSPQEKMDMMRAIMAAKGPRAALSALGRADNYGGMYSLGTQNAMKNNTLRAWLDATQGAGAGDRVQAAATDRIRRTRSGFPQAVEQP